MRFLLALILTGPRRELRKLAGIVVAVAGEIGAASPVERTPVLRSAGPLPFPRIGRWRCGHIRGRDGRAGVDAAIVGVVIEPFPLAAADRRPTDTPHHRPRPPAMSRSA